MTAAINIITGFLGSGKTTAILGLLRHAPTDERWAVLVNEFGEVGIDGAVIGAAGVRVREVSGGCICCTAAAMSRDALVEILDEVAPDRLLIEPTGMALPHDILTMLDDPAIGGRVDVRAMLCLVDPWVLRDDQFRNIGALEDQMRAADVLLAAKADAVERADLARFHEYATGFEPAKIHVGEVHDGQVDAGLLQLAHTPGRATGPHHHHAGDTKAEVVSTRSDDGLERHESAGEGMFACGWIIPAGRTVDEAALEAALADDAFIRAKGLLRTATGWRVLNKTRGRFHWGDSFEDMDEAASGRLEVISNAPEDWAGVEAAIRTSLR